MLSIGLSVEPTGLSAVGERDLAGGSSRPTDRRVRRPFAVQASAVRSCANATAGLSTLAPNFARVTDH